MFCQDDIMTAQFVPVHGGLPSLVMPQQCIACAARVECCDSCALVLHVDVVCFNVCRLGKNGRQW